MTCDAPIQAYYGREKNPATGKRPLVWRPAEALTGMRMSIPCGKCTGCRLDRSRQWAVRLMHEKRMHKEASFVTLTYDNENLPTVGTLVPRHLQLFHKRLVDRWRNYFDVGVRYYGCGEYGDLNRRPHYHSILFGVRFDDARLYSRNAAGDPIYSSELLDEIWGLGQCKIGKVTFESCAYVARYCVKKVDGKKREDGHYVVYDADGVVHERVPEFAHMSRRPGLGAAYFDRYGSEIAVHDSIIVDGKEVPSIRYYDQKLAASDPQRLAELKLRRLAKRQQDSVIKVRNRGAIERRTTKRKLRDIALSKKERRL